VRITCGDAHEVNLFTTSTWSLRRVSSTRPSFQESGKKNPRNCSDGQPPSANRQASSIKRENMHFETSQVGDAKYQMGDEKNIINFLLAKAPAPTVDPTSPKPEDSPAPSPKSPSLPSNSLDPTALINATPPP
jgi:hypothetical protein